MNKKCLIIGGSGFLGKHIVRELLNNDIPVRVFGRSIFEMRNSSDIPADFEVVLGNVLNKNELDAALEGITDIVYLVHTTVPSTSMNDIVFDLESNIFPLINLLQSLDKHGLIERFLFFSSGGTVYGNLQQRQPVNENHLLLPISSYGLTKMIGEHYIRLCLSKSRIRSYVIRPSNVYGEWQKLDRPQGVVGHFLKALITDTTITIYGDGRAVRDYVYAGDVAAAVRMCLQDKVITDNTPCFYNVGSSRAVSLLGLIEIIQNVTGKRLKINFQQDRGYDCSYNVLDCNAIYDRFGWLPKLKLEDGIKMMWDYIQEELADE